MSKVLDSQDKVPGPPSSQCNGEEGVGGTCNKFLMEGISQKIKLRIKASLKQEIYKE